MKKQKLYKNVTPEEEKQIRENLKENPLSRKDKQAMYIAAFLVLLPAILVIMGLFVLIVWFFFGR